MFRIRPARAKRAAMRLLLLPLLAACAADVPADASCAVPETLADGAVEATVDGAGWASTATWLWQADGVQLNIATADGWRVTLVAQSAADGATIRDAVDAAAFPVEVALEEGGGGWAIAYPEDGGSYSTNAGSGAVTFTALDSDVLAGCFAFEAAHDDGAVAFADGAVRALPFE